MIGKELIKTITSDVQKTDKEKLGEALDVIADLEKKIKLFKEKIKEHKVEPEGYSLITVKGKKSYDLEAMQSDLMTKIDSGDVSEDEVFDKKLKSVKSIKEFFGNKYVNDFETGEAQPSLTLRKKK